MKIKTRRRKVPVTSSSRSDVNVKMARGTGTGGGGGDSANPRTSARLIRRFHVLLKREARLEKKVEPRTGAGVKDGDSEEGVVEREREIELELGEVREEIERMGGLEVYQRMSRIGQGKDRGGGSERVFVEWLRELGVRRRREEEGKGKGKMR